MSKDSTVPLSAYNTDLKAAIKLLKEWQRRFGLKPNQSPSDWHPAHQDMNAVADLTARTKDFVENV